MPRVYAKLSPTVGKKPFEQLNGGYQRKLQLATERAAELVVGQVQGTAPVDTGALSRSAFWMSSRYDNREEAKAIAEEKYLQGKKPTSVRGLDFRTRDWVGDSYVRPTVRFIAVVGMGMRYAIYQEIGYTLRDGTVMPGKYYFRRAIESARSIVHQLLQESLTLRQSPLREVGRVMATEYIGPDTPVNTEELLQIGGMGYSVTGEGDYELLGGSSGG